MEQNKLISYFLIAFSLVLLIFLAFVKADIDKRDAFLCEEIASNPSLNMTQCPAHESNTSWFLVGSFGVAFLILGAGIYLFFIPFSSKKEAKSINTSKLSAEEKKIYSLLKENEGSSYQSDLVKETGFSKVKLTRILDRMEQKGILERKRRGMTNLVVLK